MNRTFHALAIILAVACVCASSLAQSLGSAGTVEGVVTDPTGAVIQGASVEIQNSVTGLKRETTTDDSGVFRFIRVHPILIT